MNIRTAGAGDDRTARERLLAAAAELFARKGYAATSVGEIVAKAAVTKPVLYYWFRNKEGIYLELMREAFRRFEKEIATVRGQDGSARRRLARLCDRVLELLAEQIEVARIMYSLSYGPPQGAPAFDFEAYHTLLRETVRTLIAEGMRTREFRRREAEECTWAVLGALSICVEAHLSHPELAPHTRRIFARTFAVIMQGIAAPKKKEIPS